MRTANGVVMTSELSLPKETYPYTLDDSLRSHKINNCWHEINNCYTVLGDNGKGGMSRHVQHKHKYSHCIFHPW